MRPAARSWQVWGTTAEVLVTDPARLDEAYRITVESLARVGDAIDRLRDDSELSLLAGRAAEGLPVSPLLADVVRAALGAAAATDGLVDPTLGAVLRDVGYDRDLRLVVDDGRPVRAVLRRRPPWRQVRVEDGRLFVPDGVELDLGAIGKAFTADATATVAAALLGCGVLVNLGGDLAAAGPSPDGGWQVRVQDLPGDAAAQVAMPAGWGIATSSTQRRRWLRGGLPMHHILDPSTGLPAPVRWRTVTVAAPSAVRANTLTTAAIVDGAGALTRLAAAGHPARLVAADGQVVLLNGWPDEARSAA